MDSGSRSGQHGVNQISFLGEKSEVESLKLRVLQQIKEKEKQIQDERSRKTNTVPNITEFQISYLERINFFKDMEEKYKLGHFTFDKSNHLVEMNGLPSATNEVQKRMLEILPAVTQSRCHEIKKPLFLKVFQTRLAQESLQKELLAKNLVAVWTLEGKTVSMYSESKAKAKNAMDCLNETIWEAQYPNGRAFDELEERLLKTPKWDRKREELERLADPLQITMVNDKPVLAMVGLKYQKGQVLEEIPAFFNSNVLRQERFVGSGKRVSFLHKIYPAKLKEIEQRFSVEIQREKRSEVLNVSGTKDAIANATRELKRLLEDVQKDEYTVDSPAMARHIMEDKDLLENVSLRTNCFVAVHEDDIQARPTEEMVRTTHSPNTDFYSTNLPGGTTCVVKRGDITKLNCDVIVNPANENLAHVGGLAHVIVREGRWLK